MDFVDNEDSVTSAPLPHCGLDGNVVEDYVAHVVHAGVRRCVDLTDVH